MTSEVISVITEATRALPVNVAEEEGKQSLMSNLKKPACRDVWQKICIGIFSLVTILIVVIVKNDNDRFWNAIDKLIVSVSNTYVRQQNANTTIPEFV